MTLLVMLIAGVLGYWLVSFLIDQLPANQAKQPARRADSAMPDRLAWACQTLRITLPVDLFTLQDAYRECMQDYGPDKLAALSGELRQMAEQRVREINEAYVIVAEHLCYSPTPPAV